ncbi:hypothetical protein LDENG_00035160 [Lucifuga dentata]|nr:hypothetical protein LDENG_00035160 [Lucifuga dentata]
MVKMVRCYCTPSCEKPLPSPTPAGKSKPFCGNVTTVFQVLLCKCTRIFQFQVVSYRLLQQISCFIISKVLGCS